MKLLWTLRAKQDLLEIAHYIARGDPHAARRWVQRLRSRARKAAEMPHAGRVVPEFQRQDIREVLVRNYRIVYQVGEDTVVVLTVFEGHRLFPKETAGPLE